MTTIHPPAVCEHGVSLGNAIPCAVCVEFCADVRARDFALRAWLGNRNSYKAEELPASVKPPTNEERSRAEVFEFMHRRGANAPSEDTKGPYLAYLRGVRFLSGETEPHITTFTGDVLARVTWEGESFRGNMGNTWTPFRALGIDGREWYGRHNGAGMYLRMRPRKPRKSAAQRSQDELAAARLRELTWHAPKE